MQVSILTQDNHFLINGSTHRLVEALHSIGLDVIVFRTSATAKGGRTTKFDALLQVIRFCGWVFALRSLALYSRSKLVHRDGKLRQLCKVIDVPNSVMLTADLFRAHCREFNVLLILSGTRIIKKDVIDLWHYGVLNVHSSLLPHARGLMPALWTYATGRGMGVTLFRIDEGIDTGEIIAQVQLAERSPTYLDHLLRTKSIGVTLLLAWVLDVLLGCGRRIEIESTYNKYPGPSFRLKNYL
jgi:Formyl transferase